MNGIYIVVLNYLFQHQFNPGRNAAEGTNVPVAGTFGDGFYFFVPILHPGNFLARLIKTSKPKRDVAGTYSANLPFQKLILFLQMGTTAQHQYFLFKKI